jgi:3-oxoacyl-[acyl-carrier-protein] synthase III
VHFDLLTAMAETCPADGVYFDYHVRKDVLVPTAEGGRSTAPQRLVFSLNGLGIGDAAPRAMAAAAEKALRDARISPKEVSFVVPHQAGSGIVRLTAMQLDRIGVGGAVINGLTRDVANIRSSSVPYAILREWDRLDGIVLCPTAGVGNPGDATATRGCAILSATPIHHVRVAASSDLRRAS